MADQHHRPAVGRERDADGTGRDQPVELLAARLELVAGTQIPAESIPEGGPAGTPRTSSSGVSSREPIGSYQCTLTRRLGCSGTLRWMLSRTPTACGETPIRLQVTLSSSPPGPDRATDRYASSSAPTSARSDSFNFGSPGTTGELRCTCSASSAWVSKVKPGISPAGSSAGSVIAPGVAHDALGTLEAASGSVCTTPEQPGSTASAARVASSRASRRR